MLNGEQGLQGRCLSSAHRGGRARKCRTQRADMGRRLSRAGELWKGDSPWPGPRAGVHISQPGPLRVGHGGRSTRRWSAMHSSWRSASVADLASGEVCYGSRPGERRGLLPLADLARSWAPARSNFIEEVEVCNRSTVTSRSGQVRFLPRSLAVPARRPVRLSKRTIGPHSYEYTHEANTRAARGLKAQ